MERGCSGPTDASEPAAVLDHADRDVVVVNALCVRVYAGEAVDAAGVVIRTLTSPTQKARVQQRESLHLLRPLDRRCLRERKHERRKAYSKLQLESYQMFWSDRMKTEQNQTRSRIDCSRIFCGYSPHRLTSTDRLNGADMKYVPCFVKFSSNTNRVTRVAGLHTSRERG